MLKYQVSVQRLAVPASLPPCCSRRAFAQASEQSALAELKSIRVLADHADMEAMRRIEMVRLSLPPTRRRCCAANWPTPKNACAAASPLAAARRHGGIGRHGSGAAALPAPPRRQAGARPARRWASTDSHAGPRPPAGAAPRAQPRGRRRRQPAAHAPAVDHAGGRARRGRGRHRLHDVPARAGKERAPGAAQPRAGRHMRGAIR